jgi:glycine cleavage system H lipoate-binding protein
MEALTYTDIFSQKGLEYLLVIGFLVAFVMVWQLLGARRTALPRTTTKSTHGVNDWFNLNDELYYHQGHTWAAPEGNRVMAVGVDDFAQKLLGVPGSVKLPALGSEVAQGGKGWQFEVHAKPVDMLSPVGGKVIAVNEKLVRSPGLVCEDPYGKGWLLKVRVADERASLKNLLSGKLARAWMDQSVDSIRERMAGLVGAVLQDGGLPLSGFAISLSPDGWRDIVDEYLLGE